MQPQTHTIARAPELEFKKFIDINSKYSIDSRPARGRRGVRRIIKGKGARGVKGVCDLNF